MLEIKQGGNGVHGFYPYEGTKQMAVEDQSDYGLAHIISSGRYPEEEAAARAEWVKRFWTGLNGYQNRRGWAADADRMCGLKQRQ